MRYSGAKYLSQLLYFRSTSTSGQITTRESLPFSPTVAVDSLAKFAISCS